LAQLSRPTEDQVKAAYLYNFAKFVEWPPATFSSPDAPILICSIGDDRTGEALQQAVFGKRANGRRLEARNIGLLRESKSCHILFIGFHDEGQVAEILRGVQDAHVLTVCASQHFIKLGGMINLVRNAGSIELEINPEAAQAVGLKISSRLLVVSRVVTTAGRGGQP
jgi:YfiR/HmsC-like